MELKDIPRPNYIAGPIYPYQQCGCGCGCFAETDDPIKRDCYYYYEAHDMGAHIDCCSLVRGFGVCPCKNCKDYVSNEEISKVVEEYISNRNKGEAK